MRVLFWYCTAFRWRPNRKSLDDAPAAHADGCEHAVVAFVHVEPGDVEAGSSAPTRLVKNAKWLARKWDTRTIVLHSFTHLGEDKADAEPAQALLTQAAARLNGSDYRAVQTPYGYFSDIAMEAPGQPLARIYKAF